uniref:Uncharacterized protein n=1 Tax=Romanomermis culicivorax TaxID=13658 RepID=A0A915KZS0_ROMCU
MPCGLSIDGMQTTLKSFTYLKAILMATSKDTIRTCTSTVHAIWEKKEKQGLLYSIPTEPFQKTLDMAKDNKGNGITRSDFKNGKC